MKKLNQFKTLFAIAIIFVALSSCQKEELPQATNNAVGISLESINAAEFTEVDEFTIDNTNVNTDDGYGIESRTPAEAKKSLASVTE